MAKGCTIGAVVATLYGIDARLAIPKIPYIRLIKTQARHPPAFARLPTADAPIVGGWPERRARSRRATVASSKLQVALSE